jgi:putative transposase
MDFVHDTLTDVRPFQILTVVDNWSRHSPVLKARVWMAGETVGQMFDRVLGTHTAQRSITVDHGTEFQSRALEDWAYRRSVHLDLIRPGNPMENAVMGSCNGRLRDESLNVHQFVSLGEAQAIIEAWRMDYNHHRPHHLLGHLTPNEFVAQRQGQPIVEEALCSGEELSRKGTNVRGNRIEPVLDLAVAQRSQRSTCVRCCASQFRTKLRPITHTTSYRRASIRRLIGLPVRTVRPL